VYSAVFSPDGRRIASAGQDRTVKVWDASNGQQLLSLTGHTSQVYSAEFSPDGHRIASASQDKTARVWDGYKSQQVLSLTGRAGWVTGVAFSPDGRRVATGDDNAKVCVWDAHKGQQILALTEHTTWVDRAVFSPDGRRIATTGHDRTVKVWDARTGQQLLSLTGHTARATGAAFSSDGQRLATVSDDKTVKVWDTRNDRQVLSLEGHTGPGTSVAFSPDGRRTASASEDKTVKVWDAQTGQELLSLEGHTGGVNSVAFSPDGRRIATAGGGKTVKVWDAQTGQQLLSLTGHTSGVWSVAYSPDGRRIASASHDHTVKLWDAHTGQLLLSLTDHPSVVYRVAFSPDGRRVASGGYDKTVRVWDAQTGRLLLSPLEHTGTVTSVAFSPDGKRLLSASGGEVQVWDPNKGLQRFYLTGPTPQAPVTSLAFSPDSQQVLARIANDSILLVWDSTTGRPLGEASVALPAASREATSPDGRLHVSVDPRDNRTVLVRRLRQDGRFPDDAGVPPPGFQDFDPDLHLRLAGEAEDTGNAFAAAFHVGLVLRHRPHDAVLHVRHAHLLAELGRREQAVTHLLHALFLHPRVTLVPLDPGAAARGEQAAQAGNWSRAARAFERAARQPEASGNVLVAALLAHTAAGDDAGCHRIAAELFRRLQTEKDARLRTPLLARALEVPCNQESALILLACASADLERQRNATTLHRQGAALFRAGRHSEAARVLAESVQTQGKGGYVDTWLFQAMTARHLGQQEQARDLLKRFEQWHALQTFPDWQTRVRWDALLKETRQVVAGPPPMPRLDDRE
jgi:WD40 repeat protein/Flp pilus assembly protein TadD